MYLAVGTNTHNFQNTRSSTTTTNMAAPPPAHKSMAELKDIVYNDMKAFYDRGEVEKDIREVLRLEHAIERECESRNADARDIIRGKTESIRGVKTAYS